MKLTAYKDVWAGEEVVQYHVVGDPDYEYLICRAGADWIVKHKRRAPGGAWKALPNLYPSAEAAKAALEAGAGRPQPRTRYAAFSKGV